MAMRRSSVGSTDHYGYHGHHHHKSRPDTDNEIADADGQKETAEEHDDDLGHTLGDRNEPGYQYEG